MANFDPTKIYTVPGQFFVGPTQNGIASLTPPFGGTPLGFINGCRLIVEEESFDIVSEAKGKRTGWIRGITTFGFEFEFIQWDTDLMALLYATAGGVTTTFREPDIGSTLQPGLVTPGSPLLFAPYDVLTHPGALIFAPTYSQGTHKEANQEISTVKSEHVRVVANEDSNGHVFATDFLNVLSLT